MSLVKDAIRSIVEKGIIEHEFTIQDTKFVIRSLTTEEQFLADGMVDSNRLREKYKTDKLITLNDTIQKHRTISMVALATKLVNGHSPVDENESLENQFKQRLELRDELMSLGSGYMDQIITEYNKLKQKEAKFYQNVEENVEKS